MPSPDECPFKPGIYLRKSRTQTYDANTFKWVYVSHEEPVVVLRDVTDYASHILVLRWNIEVMLSNGDVVVLTKVPSPYESLIPLNNVPATE